MRWQRRKLDRSWPSAYGRRGSSGSVISVVVGSDGAHPYQGLPHAASSARLGFLWEGSPTGPTCAHGNGSGSAHPRTPRLPDRKTPGHPDHDPRRRQSPRRTRRIHLRPDRSVARVISTASSRKVANIAINPSGFGAICQVDGGRWLTLEGSCSVSSDPVRVAEAVAAYAHRYRQPKERANSVVLEISVERVIGRV